MQGPGVHSGWARLGAGGCASPPEKQLALQSASVPLLSASKLLQAVLFDRCLSYISTAVHFDLCSREAAEPPSQSEEQLLEGLKALLLCGGCCSSPGSSAGLPNSGNTKLSSEPFHRRACQSGETTNNCGKSRVP